MAALGCPLLGDQSTGGRRATRRCARSPTALGRQALHARLLGFVHPATGKGWSSRRSRRPTCRRRWRRCARSEDGVSRAVRIGLTRRASCRCCAPIGDPAAFVHGFTTRARRRQRAAVRHAEPGRQVGRRPAPSPRIGGAFAAAAGGRAGSSRARCTAARSCACAPATTRRTSRGSRRTGSAPRCPGVAVGVFVADCVPMLRRRCAHGRVRGRARRVARDGGGRAARGGARAGRRSSARDRRTCGWRWARRSAPAASRSVPRSSRPSRPPSPRRARAASCCRRRAAAPARRTSICKAANRLLLERAGVDPGGARRRLPRARTTSARVSSRSAATARDRAIDGRRRPHRALKVWHRDANVVARRPPPPLYTFLRCSPDN